MNDVEKLLKCVSDYDDDIAIGDRTDALEYLVGRAQIVAEKIKTGELRVITTPGIKEQDAA